MKEQAYENTPLFERSYWWYRGRHEIIMTLLNKLCEKHEKPSILDVGCGTGWFLESLSKNADVYGIERKFQSPDYVSDNIKKKIAIAELPDIPMREAAFDGILALDIIEHLDDDKGALTALKRKLKPGGFLFLTVPAFDFLWSGEDYVSEHKRRYNRKTLSTALISAGYRIERISYFNCFLFPLVIFTILFKRLFCPHSMYQSSLEPLPKILNNILEKIFKSEITWLKTENFPFGASLFVVARS